MIEAGSMFGLKRAVFAGVLAIILTHGEARATYNYDITITGGFTGVGQISLATTTGFFQPASDTNNLVSDFFLTVTAQTGFITTRAGAGPVPPLPFTFDRSAVSTFSWSIDPFDQSLSLFVFSGPRRIIIPPDPGQVAYAISIDTLGFDGGQRFIQVDCFTGVYRPDAPAAFCSSALEPTGRFSTGNVRFSLSPIPEPTTLAIFALGLLGLSLAQRRKMKGGV